MLRNTIYYNLKPFIPRALRTAARRQLVKGMRHKVGDVWPIMPGSEVKPNGWPGWPHGKKFALVLTHDVEGQAGLKKCRALMQAEMEMGFRSSFNFIPEGSYRAPSTLRQELLQNGFEVGVHDLRHDGRLFRSVAGFRTSAIRINRYLQEWGAVGFRSGFMLHKLDWLHQLKIEYDMSTFDTDPFEPQPEGRHTIFPSWIPRLPAISPVSNGAGAANGSSAGYVELPYTLPQDSTLFLLLQERSTAIWLRKLDWIAAHGGMALINTHPDYMSFNGSAAGSFEYPVRFYKEFLSYIRDNYAGSYWRALPREVAAHCSPSRRMPDERAETLIPASREVYSTLATDLDVHGRSGDFSLAKVGLAEPESTQSAIEKRHRLRGKHAAVILFSYFPADPRPRRAAEALIAEGVTVDMICLQNEGVPSREVIAGVNVFRLPIKRCRGSKTKYVSQYSAFIVRAFWMLASRSFSRRYDFVHVHNMPDVLVFSALVPKVLGAKIILDLHDPMPELMQTIFGMSESSFGVRILKVLEKMSIGFADSVLTVNIACKRIYSSRSCRPEKITVVMNAPEDTIFRLKPPSCDLAGGNGSTQPFSLLYHGSLVPRNGLDLAVDALEIASHRIPNLQLRVCGERNSYFEKVMESAHRRGLGAKVIYLGMKNLWEIVEAINCCDLGVVPNQRNTFTEINTPTRIFEYLSLGKPVLAPRTLGIEDYFGNDDLIFFEAGDKQDLARQIESAYTNREELLRVVERGQRVYLAHTWSQQKSNFLETLGELF